MNPLNIMVIAGEASGDSLAAGLVQALREELAAGGPEFTTDYQPLHASLAPRFFGAGGPAMRRAGVELAFDLTEHSLIGLSEAAKQYFKFRRFAMQLRELARERRPDAIICVDFGHFNRKFAQSIRKLAARPDWFHDWQPKIVQYVSPQVWASRESRVYSIAREFDLLLSIFPFEKDWYAKRVPRLPVEFVGHPLIDRFGPSPAASRPANPTETPVVLLLPGSRPGELRRHLPLLLEASKKIIAAHPVRFLMVVPHESLREISRPFEHEMPNLLVQTGGLEKALAQADIALTKSGTITMECAYFGVPAVVFYKTSFITYVVGRQIVKVKYLAMPNLLADEPLYPEFVQSDATAENLANATLGLINDTGRRQKTRQRLAEIVSRLGPPGANHRAAKAILRLLGKAT
jgi:lipid-A-disaccharide synthase